MIIGELELAHALDEHFGFVPRDVVLEILERVLRDPVAIFEEQTRHVFHIFYKIDRGKYLVAIIKKTSTGTYFATMYPTGTTIRGKHKKLRRIR